MQIDLADLPEEGKQFDGEISPEIFDIIGTDIISVSPLNYSLFVQRFDTELLLTGPIEAAFQLTCQRSLHPFSKTISMPNVAISIELGADGFVEAAEHIREDSSRQTRRRWCRQRPRAGKAQSMGRPRRTRLSRLTFLTTQTHGLTKTSHL